jgi:hypothetical protein
MIFINLLEQVMQSAKRHARNIPMEILRLHGGDGRFRQRLVKSFDDFRLRIRRDIDFDILHGLDLLDLENDA